MPSLLILSTFRLMRNVVKTCLSRAVKTGKTRIFTLLIREIGHFSENYKADI